jgi:hypothetical protein
MSFTIRLDSPASPEQVLAALREDTREWREAALPPELRRHARRVAVRIRGEAFTLSYEYRREVGPDVVLRGAVRPGDAGGTRVIAAAGLARGVLGRLGILGPPFDGDEPDAPAT